MQSCYIPEENIEEVKNLIWKDLKNNFAKDPAKFFEFLCNCRNYSNIPSNSHINSILKYSKKALIYTNDQQDRFEN